MQKSSEFFMENKLRICWFGHSHDSLLSGAHWWMFGKPWPGKLQHQLHGVRVVDNDHSPSPICI